MNKEELEFAIDFLEDLMHHWEEDLFIGMCTLKEYDNACRRAYKEIDEYKEQLKKFV